jgi:citronellol/citronellal dehydrogenase
MTSLSGKTLFITGASRGIGKAIAIRAARDGANVAVVAKTDTPHPKLPGTVHSAVEEIEAAGGKGLAIVCDIREDAQIAAAVKATVERFGGIDILVNNASAISLTDTASTPMKRYDLMHQINARGTYACTQACLPWLEKGQNSHVLTLSPPLDMDAKWFAPHVAYTMAKFGMSMCVLGHSAEFRGRGIAVNALWPKTTIATAAIEMLAGAAGMQTSRTPEIMADAAHWIFTQSSRECTGNFFIDEAVMRGAGVEDLTKYAVDPSKPLTPDFFV